MLKYRYRLGGRLTVRLQTLDLRIGVRIPASQPVLGSPRKPKRWRSGRNRGARGACFRYRRAGSVDAISRLEGKWRDVDIEPSSVRPNHLIGAVHHSHGGLQRAPGRIFERLSRRQGGLLSDDPGSINLFDVVERIRNDPMPAKKLNGFGPFVGNAHRILEHPLVVQWPRVLRRVSCQNLDPNIAGEGIGHRSGNRTQIRHAETHDSRLRYSDPRVMGRWVRLKRTRISGLLRVKVGVCVN